MIKKDVFVIVTTIIIFSLMAFILGEIYNSEPFWGAGIGGALGWLGFYYYRRKKVINN